MNTQLDWAIFYGRHNCRFSPMAHRGGRAISADALRISALLRVSRDGQEREHGSEDNPNVNAHQSSPLMGKVQLKQFMKYD